MSHPIKPISIGIVSNVAVADLIQQVEHYHVVKLDLLSAQAAIVSEDICKKKQYVDKLNTFDVLLADPEMIAPIIYDLKMEWIQSTWSGVDQLLAYVDCGSPPDITVTRCSGVYGALIADYVICNIINYERDMFGFAQAQRQSLWDSSCVPYRHLEDLSISVIGLGSIGSEIARRLKFHGMTVYGMASRIPDDKQSYVDEYFVKRSLPEYLSKSDYVCSVLPKTPETDLLLDDDVLAHCVARKSVLINVGRGNVIRDESIVKAIRSGWIRGAILDVFEKEPLPSSSSLWHLPGVIITPHVSGLTLPRHLASCFMDNLKLYERGQPLRYVVDWKKGY